MLAKELVAAAPPKKSLPSMMMSQTFLRRPWMIMLTVAIIYQVKRHCEGARDSCLKAPFQSRRLKV